jgi:hypothetical protein
MHMYIDGRTVYEWVPFIASVLFCSSRGISWICCQCEIHWKAADKRQERHGINYHLIFFGALSHCMSGIACPNLSSQRLASCQLNKPFLAKRRERQHEQKSGRHFQFLKFSLDAAQIDAPVVRRLTRRSQGSIYTIRQIVSHETIFTDRINPIFFVRHFQM